MKEVTKALNENRVSMQFGEMLFHIYPIYTVLDCLYYRQKNACLKIATLSVVEDANSYCHSTKTVFLYHCLFF